LPFSCPFDAPRSGNGRQAPAQSEARKTIGYGSPHKQDIAAAHGEPLGAEIGWERYTGSDGAIIGMRTFGASAPLKALQKRFGFTPDHLLAVVCDVLGRRR